MQDMEDSLILNIDQVMASANKKFADKVDTRKSLRMLERQMKNLFELMTRDLVSTVYLFRRKQALETKLMTLWLPKNHLEDIHASHARKI